MLVRVWFTVTFTVLVAVSPAASEIVTRNEYEPARLKVTAEFLAAFVPLTPKTGVAPAGAATACQVYDKFASPPSSAPRTVRVVVVPITGLGEAAAACATVGAWFPVEP